MPKPQLLKIAALAVLVFAVAVVYSLIIIVRYTLEGCVTTAARWGPLSVGSPYYVFLRVDSLIPYSRTYCTSPAFATGGKLLYVVEIATPGYVQTVARCLGEGEFMGFYPNPYYSGSLTVIVRNSCIVRPSYYTRFTLSLYYD